MERMIQVMCHINQRPKPEDQMPSLFNTKDMRIFLKMQLDSNDM